MFDNRIALLVREAAEATGYTPYYLRKKIYEGKLRAFRPDGTGDLRILRTDLIKWIKAQGKPAKRPTPPNFNRAA